MLEKQNSDEPEPDELTEILICLSIGGVLAFAFIGVSFVGILIWENW
jgi:hypothetical protein